MSVEPYSSVWHDHSLLLWSKKCRRCYWTCSCSR